VPKPSYWLEAQRSPVFHICGRRVISCHSNECVILDIIVVSIYYRVNELHVQFDLVKATGRQETPQSSSFQ